MSSSHPREVLVGVLAGVTSANSFGLLYGRPAELPWFGWVSAFALATHAMVTTATHLLATTLEAQHSRRPAVLVTDVLGHYFLNGALIAGGLWLGDKTSVLTAVGWAATAWVFALLSIATTFFLRHLAAKSMRGKRLPALPWYLHALRSIGALLLLACLTFSLMQRPNAIGISSIALTICALAYLVLRVRILGQPFSQDQGSPEQI